MPPKKAAVDNSATIRSASRKKQRPQPSDRAGASPFGSSSGGSSLASSLSSLFSPHPHGKDAALASLLASSSKPAVKLGQASGLAAFGSFSGAPSGPPTTSAPRILDDRQKEKRKDVSDKPGPSKPAVAAEGQGVTQKPSASVSRDEEVEVSAPKDRVQKASTSAFASAVSTSVPSVPAGRRPVFRPVLASSTAVTWPEMPVAGSKTVLHTLIEILGHPDVQVTLHRDLGRRSRLRSSKTTDVNENTKMDVDGEEGPSLKPAPPQVLAGINSITRAIEHDIAADLAKLHSRDTDVKQKGKASQEATARPRVKVVFVCRHDVPQPSLIAHLPMLITARNAVSQALTTPTEVEKDSSGVFLFALPSGSESLLAKALNLRRASVVALTTAFVCDRLTQLLEAIERETGSLCHLRASWLETAIRSATQSASNPLPLSLRQQPTSVKLLRTTQPLDLNKCKAEKKTKRKERSARWKQKKCRLQQRVKRLSAEMKAAQRKERSKKAARSADVS
ncbi:hypothetical protein PSEUBRA_005518 [Kalmanozyma brasiliensis GHG001]|uniref:uncharacterized protein n=1 Tax=Kalmanozyma brasiliensis (strain GHG001) TaxID=1365824 RepID=UPI00286828BB|nr:uncharacterized protein PSEUBRA_005518 [Kalmanozyma brasiliensis GHG001]KAF6767526.1 hypothetical protein PSEUBRA_005518 [Kalmanozyma brasiliensis GHG001]